MATSNTPPLDLILNPLVDITPGIGEWSPTGTLKRTVVAVEFLATLIANIDGHSNIFEDSDARQALILQLDAVAGAIRVVAAALADAPGEGAGLS